MPAKARIHYRESNPEVLDSRLRGNDSAPRLAETLEGLTIAGAPRFNGFDKKGQ
jgi:hypothetical protein